MSGGATGSDRQGNEVTSGVAMYTASFAEPLDNQDMNGIGATERRH